MGWVCTWGAAQYYGDNSGDEGKASALRVSKTLQGATLRQIIRTTVGGDKLRLTFSNEYGTEKMVLKEVHVAKAAVLAQSYTDLATDKCVTFNGSNSIAIPAGKTITSDPIDIHVNSLERVAVSIYFGWVPKLVSCHVGARAKSFVTQGNCVSAEVLNNADINSHWFTLSRADVLRSGDPCCVVAFGDSITDGYGVIDEQYTRWTDVLARWLQQNPATQHIGVVNMGIGANHLLNQVNPLAAAQRFERDVINIQGVKYAIILIGVNDLKFATPPVSTQALKTALSDMFTKAQSKNINVFACTILPYSTKDPRRHEINNWLRGLDQANNPCFRLIDIDELLRDCTKPDFMQPQYDNDGLHPSFEGYKAMGNLSYKIMTQENQLSESSLDL